MGNPKPANQQNLEPLWFAFGCFFTAAALGLVYWAFSKGTLTPDQRFLLMWALPVTSGFACGSWAGALRLTGPVGRLAVTAVGGFGVWLLSYFLLKPPTTQTGGQLFGVVENINLSRTERSAALRVLLFDYGWKDFRNRNLSGLTLTADGWVGADLTEADLRNISAVGVNFTRACLIRANMTGADVSDAVFTDDALNGAILFKTKCSRTDFEGTCFWNSTCDECIFDSSRLKGSYLGAASFVGANFTGSVLKDASFCLGGGSPSVMTRANFANTDLRGTDFETCVGLDTATFSNAWTDSETVLPQGFKIK